MSKTPTYEQLRARALTSTKPVILSPTAGKRAPERGDHVLAPGGAEGWYVGKRGGQDWIAYRLEDLKPMSDAFDGNDSDDASWSGRKKSMRPGGGGRFAQMVAGGKSQALAAYIGRRAYGPKQMAKWSAAGRKRAERARAAEFLSHQHQLEGSNKKVGHAELKQYLKLLHNNYRGPIVTNEDFAEAHREYVAEMSRSRREHEGKHTKMSKHMVLGYSVASPMVTIGTPHALGVLPKAGLIVLGAGIGPRLNASLPWRPLGEQVTPSRMAIPVTFGVAYAARAKGMPRLADASMSMCIGLVAGEITRAIAGAVSA